MSTLLPCIRSEILLDFLTAYLSTIDVVQDKIQFVCSLEGKVKPDQEGVFYIFQQDIALWHNVLLLKT